MECFWIWKDRRRLEHDLLSLTVQLANGVQRMQNTVRYDEAVAGKTRERANGFSNPRSNDLWFRASMYF